MSLFARDTCVACDGSTPACNCASGEQCILTSRTCSQCPSIQCIKGSSSSSGGSVNPGVIAGPVVAVLAIASLGLFWWLRKKKRRDLAHLEELAARARKAETAGFHLSQPSSPQPPSARSGSGRSRASQLPAVPPSAATHRSGQRSPLPPVSVNVEYYDESGASVRVYRGNGTINLDPNHPDNGGPGDPFSDRQSVSTMNSQSTNIIPIQYIPPSKSDDGIAHTASSPQAGSQSQAARTLDEARQNLLRPRQTPPQRPARTPDLHLRLSPPHGRDSPQDLRSPGAVPAGQIRDSYLSANSSTPSFLSGNSYDIHTDAPKIVTSKQVHVGRLQQAEVVQLGQKELFGGQTKLSPIPPAQYDPSTGAQNHLLPSAAVGPYCPSPSPSAAYAMPIVRSLTPGSRTSHVEDAEEGLVSEEPMAAGPTDLRFSMGSLAYERNSVSTMETSKFFARPDSSFALTPPRPQHQHQHQQQYEQRESMFSTKSYADSFLGGFPMIPPLQPGAAVPALPASALPQSTSVSTLDHHATVGRPPAAFRPLTSVRPGTSGSVITRPGTAPCRPITATSTTDSFLGTFPFVQPNVDDLAELPSAGMPETAVSKGGNAPRSVSTTSEGLGGFDFSFGDAPPLPSRGVVPATLAA